MFILIEVKAKCPSMRTSVTWATMADAEEKAPLLVDVDEDDFPHLRNRSDPRQAVKSLFQSDRVLGRHSPYQGTDDEAINISASSSMHNFNIAEQDCVVAIFVVAFDTKAGS